MTKLTLRLAMLGMAIFLLSACGRVGHASNSTSPAKPADTPAAEHGALSSAAAAPATDAPTIAPAATPTSPATSTPSPTPLGPVTFAVIGDSGLANADAGKVAKLVKSWHPAFIIDVGDEYYGPVGSHGTQKYDLVVGKFYCDFLKDITTTGTNCPSGKADRNRYFPALGNHEYSDAHINNYLDYFKLPGSDFKSSSGNERYYDFTWTPVHFFVLNSNQVEPDGTSPDSKQGQWLKGALAASDSPWNVVAFHHPPYSSGSTHGSQAWMRWPFAEWGAQAVLSGHEHSYERIMADGIVYFVNGLGGGPRYPFAESPVKGSAARVNDQWGAQKVTATEQELKFEFYTIDGKLRDSYSIEKKKASSSPPPALSLPMILAQ